MTFTPAERAAMTRALALSGPVVRHGLRGDGTSARAACRNVTCVRFPSGLSPSVQDFHLVNR